MKKKLLLAIAMIAMLVCVLAISVSASVIYKDTSGKQLFSYVDEDGNWDFDSYEGSFPKTDNEGNALTWYITSTETVDGNTVHTVASLKTLGEAGSINDNGAYSFTSPVTNKNTVSVNFPDNAGIKTWAFKSFGGYNSRINNNILFVYCPNTLTAFENNPFQETQVIVVELDDETPITQIPQNFCHEARNLEAINIPSSVAVIKGSSGQNGCPFYRNYSLVKVIFAPNSKLVEIKNCVFQDCTSLKSVALPEGIETIGTNLFSGCEALEEAVIPNSVTSLGQRVVENCKSLVKLVYPANLTNIEQSSTYRAFNLQYIYVPNTITTSNGTHHFTTGDGTYKYSVIFFAGTEEQALALKTLVGTNNEQKINHSNYIAWDSTMSDADYVAKAETDKKHYVVYGYNTCNAFYNGIHTEKTDDNNPCWLTECDKCGVKDVYSGNDNTHNIVTEMTYTNYLANGVKKSYCTNEKCTNPVSEDALAPLFESKGYSSNDNGEMCVGYIINLEAIEAYRSFYGDALSFNYGIVAAANSENPYDLTENVVKVDLSANEYTAVDFKLSDLSESTKDIAIAMNLYVVETKGENTTVSYVTSVGTSNVAETITYATAPKEEILA